MTEDEVKYDTKKYTPPFRVGKHQGKAVIDSNGREVIFFKDSEEQAQLYCDYLNEAPTKNHKELKQLMVLTILMHLCLITYFIIF
jgi:uncharacterized membrane protein YvbJ